MDDQNYSGVVKSVRPVAIFAHYFPNCSVKLRKILEFSIVVNIFENIVNADDPFVIDPYRVISVLVAKLPGCEGKIFAFVDFLRQNCMSVVPSSLASFVSVRVVRPVHILFYDESGKRISLLLSCTPSNCRVFSAGASKYYNQS